MDTATTEAVIVETPRGPSLAGTRITVYAVMDLIKAGRSRAYVARLTTLTPEQVDAVFDYVEAHREEVEAAYARILEREAIARAESERIVRERAPYFYELPPAELHQFLLQKYEAKKKAASATCGDEHCRHRY